MCEEDPIKWTIEQILDQAKETNKLLASSKLNRIASLIPDILNQIRPTDLSTFGIDFMGQSTPNTQATDYNTSTNQNTDQITSIAQAINPQAIYPQATNPQAIYPQTTDP